VARPDLEGTLFKAALLAGHGAAARGIARRLAAVSEAPRDSESRGRSCLDAGAPIQLTVDAPGPRSLRAGVRLGADDLACGALEPLMPAGALRAAREFLAPLPPACHASLGAWLFWTQARQSIYVDLRDPSPADALARLHCILDVGQRARLDRIAAAMTCARPWVLRIDPEGSRVHRVHVHWLIDRRAAPSDVAESIAPGAWRHAVDVLGGLLKRPASSGRWVIATPLDGVSEPALRIGTTGWSLAPEEPGEHDGKHRAVAAIMQRLGGPRDYAEALWSVCRGGVSGPWRVGRACELRIQEDRVRARLFFTPRP
jgi:hypothetical protein